jgi:putative DNA methylase
MTRKLIEVALPLEAISIASRRDKDRKVGTIKNVHKWFAPMPTPAWRALLFAAVVDDPGEGPEREALLELVARLVPDDGGPPPPSALDEARRFIDASPSSPTVLDPFCGGGSTIVEALRLGLPAVGSDLNPVPVLIARTLCDLVPGVAGHRSISGGSRLEGVERPLDGFFSDVVHYAERVRDDVWQEIGANYPTPPGGGTVIAWLWARTVDCPNPACRVTIPLYSSAWLSKKRGQEIWLKRCNDRSSVWFEIQFGKHGVTPPTKSSRGAKFACPTCSTVTSDDYVRAEGRAGRMGHQMMAAAVDLDGSRVFLSPAELPTPVAVDAPVGLLDVESPSYTRDFKMPNYGLRLWSDLYSPRQLVTLAAFASNVSKLRKELIADGADEDYAKAVLAVLGLCVGKLAMSNSTQVRWRTREGPPKAEAAFGRQALPMVWDYAETNPFGGSVGDWMGQVKATIAGMAHLDTSATARIEQSDARLAEALVPPASCLVATDPPYFAQIGYADLSDYFYFWHRLALRDEFPDLYGTMTTPKEGELIAMPHRHEGNSDAAHRYYVDGFTDTFHGLLRAQHPDLPMIVVYAHRQEDGDGDDLTSSGWDAMLAALLAGGLGVVGTWPIHATTTSRQIGQGANALASYIVLVCRPRDVAAGITDRQGFIRALRKELPSAVRALQAADTLPFDMTQAAIGPGMAVFSRFARVVEPDGEPMSVKSAISLINQVRSAVLSEQDDEFDPETRWAIQWFERYGFDQGAYGEAEKLFTATATSLEGLKRTGIIQSKAPNVWLIEPEALLPGWDPVTDLKTCTWEVTMQLLRVLHHAGGEPQAAAILAKVDRFGDLARDLAYRLADICEATKRASTALAVNGLIAAWPEISRLAAMTPTPEQERLL